MILAANGDVMDNFSCWIVSISVELFLCQAKVWLDKNGETRVGYIPFPQLCQVNMLWLDKNGETRVLLEHQKSIC